HTRSYGDWSSDVCSSDLGGAQDLDAIPQDEPSIRAAQRAARGWLASVPRTPDQSRDLPGAGGKESSRTKHRSAAEDESLPPRLRSEERRVGKAGRSRVSA